MKRWGFFLGLAFCTGVLLLATNRLSSQPGADKADYVGSEACSGCHQDLAKAWERHPHTRYLMAPGREATGKGCEECHGPGAKHASGDVSAIVNPRKVKPEKEAALCLRCHQSDFKASDWHTGAHAKARVACSKCHDMHGTPKGSKLLRKPAVDLCLGCHPQQRSQFRQNSHHPVLEGRMSCLDCHDPHRQNVKSALGQAGSDLCVSCHAEKAGPFVWAHDTASGDGNDACLVCHRSHGSPHAQLQRLSGRSVCQQCHVDKATHFPGATCWRGSGCHVDIHGSNRDPRFLRR